MKTILFFIALLMNTWLMASGPNNDAVLSVRFYGEEINLSYQPELAQVAKICAKDRCIKKYYETMEASGQYQLLLDELLHYKEKWQLSDWLYYVLIRKTVEQLYQGADVEEGKEEMLNTLGTWFYLTKSGYETRLTNVSLKALFLYVPSNELVYGTSYMRDRKKRYYNLTAHYQKVNTKGFAFRMNEFEPLRDGQPFSFRTPHLPNLSPQIAHRDIEFKVDDESYTLHLELDSNALQIMRQHPTMQPMDYLEVPISQTAKASLLPQLQKLIEGKSNQEAVEILISFTRRAFTYKWDWDIYDDDKAMIADELLFSEYSDHEDRCALFYFLVKELLDLPMIIVSHFNDDLTIGIELDQPVGNAFIYNERRYTICDPTTPCNSKRLGDIPYGFKEEYIQVIGEYEPQEGE
ncbi:MAG: hypothetical protein AAFP19_10455 [Bacteroidota bacterium]